MKKLLLAFLMIAIVLSFSTCKFIDSIFFVASSVSPSDLPSYTGTPPTTRVQAIQSFGTGGMLAFEAIGKDMAQRQEFQNFGKSVPMWFFGNTPTGKLIQKAIANKLARTITLTGSGFSSADLNTVANKEIHLDIENENVNNSNVDSSGVSGAIVIDKCKVDIVGTANGLSSSHPPTSVDLTQGDADVSVTVTNFKDTNWDPNITVNGAKIGLKFKSTGNATLNSSTGAPTDLTWDVSASMKAGISVTDTLSGDYSGKYILELSYYDNGSLTSSDLSSTDPYAAIGKITFSLSIKSYDNSNNLLNSWTFDQSDLQDELESMNSPS